MDYFRDLAEQYYSEVISASPVPLSERAKADLEKPFLQTLGLIAGDTLEERMAAIAAADNPIVAFDRRLCTKEQKEKAYKVLRTQLDSAEQCLPDELLRVIRARFRLLADALSEMLGNIASGRKEVSDLLFGGTVFTTIEGIEAGAGDYHNYARAAAVIETDRGKMLYKPRNCLADVRTRLFVQKYFQGSVIVPKCYTDGASFGICEYITSERVRGKSGAEKWYYALGALAVLAQILGSCDMHFENIVASEGLPVLIDLETILHPDLITGQEPSSGRNTASSFQGEIPYSIWNSGLMPIETNSGTQVSVLMKTEGENVCAPVVDGKPATVLDYPDAFFEGFDTAYRRCLAEKENLEKDVRELFFDVPVRLMVRNTQRYADLLENLYKAGVLSTEEAHTTFSLRLEKALMSGMDRELYRGVCLSEKDAVLRGDIPYFYTSGDSTGVFDADGRVGDLIRVSGISASLKRISRMSGRELLFEKKLIREALDIVPVRIARDDPDISGRKYDALPVRSSEALSAQLAASEAGEIIKMICSRMIPAPNGDFGWTDLTGQDASPQIMRSGMFSGTTGIGVFAAAAKAVLSGEARDAAVKCEEAAAGDLAFSLEQLKEMRGRHGAPFLSRSMGEGSGMAGILRCLALMDRYSGCGRYEGMTEEALDLIMHADLSSSDDADRISGLSGLLSVMCGFPGFYLRQQVKDLVRDLADRLLELKTFEADGRVLWKTVSGRHIISGAGHGMAGIGEALCAAGALLSEQKYQDAALDALQYEEQVYSSKLGTWPDNRQWPAQGYMHGYCSGAPGIGIMMRRIRRILSASAGTDTAGGKIYDLCGRCADKAEAANAEIPLLYRDHLCCGNSSVAEYYLFSGDKERAGSVLNSMFLRKEKTGTYMTDPYGYRSQKSVLSLFYGIAGCGYEMLRYAFPDKVLSLFG